MQYIVIAHDFTDSDALSRRMQARTRHVELGDKMKDEGKLLYAVGLINEEGNLTGSVMIFDFEDENDLSNWKKMEPYITDHVWEIYKILHCKVGPSFSKYQNPLF